MGPLKRPTSDIDPVNRQKRSGSGRLRQPKARRDSIARARAKNTIEEQEKIVIPKWLEDKIKEVSTEEASKISLILERILVSVSKSKVHRQKDSVKEDIMTCYKELIVILGIDKNGNYFANHLLNWLGTFVFGEDGFIVRKPLKKESKERVSIESIRDKIRKALQPALLFRQIFEKDVTPLAIDRPKVLESW